MKRQFNGRKILIITITDILIFAVSLLTFAYFDHVRNWANEDEKAALPTFSFSPDETDGFLFSDFNDNSADDSDDNSQSNDDSSQEDSSSKEDDNTTTNSIFTDGEIISTETTYKSKYVNVTLKEIEFDGKIFYVEDIYIRKIECMTVGFAKGAVPGSGASETVEDMAEYYKNQGLNLIATINGDYCGLNKKGAIIRNGILYGTGIAEYDVCVIYKDGTMVTMEADEFDAEAELEKGAWHVWDFGPNLLDDEGNALTDFSHRRDIKGSNPRTAIGYFEPGHYCFVVAGGRGEERYGVTLEQLAGLMESLGCKVSYNLDGGRSSVMIFGDTTVNAKNQDLTRKNTDIIFIQDFSAN